MTTSFPSFTTEELLLNEKQITIGAGAKTGSATVLYKGARFNHLLLNKTVVFLGDFENDKKFKATVPVDDNIVKYYTMLCKKFRKALETQSITTIKGFEDEKSFSKAFEFENVIKPKYKNEKNGKEYSESFKITFGAYTEKNLTDGKDGKSTIPSGKSVGDFRCTFKDGANKNSNIVVNINNIMSEIPRGTKFNAKITESFIVISKKLHLTKYVNNISINRPSNSSDDIEAATDEAVGRERTESETPSFEINNDEVENGKEDVGFVEEDEVEEEEEEEEEKPKKGKKTKK